MNAVIHSGQFGSLVRLSALGVALVLVAGGCGHGHKKTAPDPGAMAPAYPSSQKSQTPGRLTPQQRYPQQLDPGQQGSSTAGSGRALGRIPITPLPPGGVTDADYEYILSHRPIESEFGMATWYTAPYKGRAAANGQVFDDMALTAAHRTLPMGSLVVVTNLKTGQASAMRISDRGPFVGGRVVDLTIASARATGIYRQGLARVRVDVYQTPKPIETGGRWCVQIGAFRTEAGAIRLKRQLLERYRGAQVIEFPGENVYWVRIRPEGDDRTIAESIARTLRPSEGEAFLTRLD